MKSNNSGEALTAQLEKLLRSKMKPVFERYGQNIDGLLTPLKWKPLVLVIGNYSSGKSTFINELLGGPVQRTGQAPTDDCFTIITKPEANEEEKEITGGTVVNDERLPFAPLRCFGESLISHLRLKTVNAPILDNLAIIDTPGMLDSVTEKDRGYEYLNVVGELARLADLIILMFDPHKAGTIKETYQAIRSTLPGSTGEDRVIYVMNRIDECDNTPDLIKSFGTLCWNLSQMTGRKDIPRIFLTYADTGKPVPEEYTEWTDEREELKAAVLTAPKKRLNHIFEEVDRGVRELSMQIEAFASFRKGFLAKSKKIFRAGAIIALLLFFFGDSWLKMATGFPETTLLSAAFSGRLTPDNFIIPALGALVIIALSSLCVRRFLLPRYVKQTLAGLDDLIPLQTAYRRDLWERTQKTVKNLIEDKPGKIAWRNHNRPLLRIDKFLEKDLRKIFEQSHQAEQ